MFLVMIFGLLAFGIVVIAYGTFARNRWGINLRPVSCPRCRTPLPRLRKPETLRQSLWGGWTCPACGVEVDKWGREVETLCTIDSRSRNGSTREGHGNSFFYRVTAKTWAFVAILLALNILYNFYHPLGFVIDGVIAIPLFIWILKSKNADQRG